MIGDIAKALGQVGDRRFLGVLIAGIALSMALLGGFSWVLVTTLQSLIGAERIADWPWLGWLSGALGVPLFLGLSVFLMVPVASAFTGLFLERIATAVEAVHYPGLPQAKGASIGEALYDSVVFLGVILGANLVALLLYIPLAPLAPLIFWALNGFLLGREYAQMVALRRLSRTEANAFRKRHRGQVFAMGLAMAVPLTVPVVNLLVPVIGAASFTHLFHRLTGRPPTG